MVSLANVVEEKISLMPPIVKVVLVIVLKLEELVCLTVTVCPLVTVPLLLVYEPPLILYVPPEIEMLAALLMPETVIAFEVIVWLVATFV